MAGSSAQDDRRHEAVLFDFFGTLVSIDTDRLPRRRIGGHEYIVTIHGLDELLAEVCPNADIETFFAALLEVSRELQETKRTDLREIPSRERFRRTLARLGADRDSHSVADEMSRRHMAALADAVVCPAGRRDLLASLAERYRLGLVSNFDDGRTVRRLLKRHRLDRPLEAVLVSDDFGKRKPGAEIFLQACSDLEIEPSRTLHVGDSYLEDICGATRAGLDAVWIDTGDQDPSPALARLEDVRDLPAWLAGARAG